MIDSHAHVAFRQFDDDRSVVIDRAHTAGVRWLEVGTDLVQSSAALALARQHPDIVIGATVGVHPSDVGPIVDPDGNQRLDAATAVGGPEGLTLENWRKINVLVADAHVAAVGEVGFDFYHPWPGFSAIEQRVLQHTTLQQFIALGSERQLPLVFHVRNGQGLDAHEALIALLHDYPEDQRPRGVVHTFSGTAEQAEQYVALGLHLSFSGVVTFKNAGEIAAVAKTMPLEKMLIETDCPFLAPQPYRGQRNEPAYVQHVAEQIAALRGVTMEEIATVTEENAVRLFRL